MPLYELTADTFRPIERTSFADLRIRERDDLQRILRAQINVLSDALDGSNDGLDSHNDGLLVLTEEFSDWEDSNRRIDLLAIDLEANLVVIELKRSADGGHMELQALRYAAMVSTMTFERAEQIHANYLDRIGEPKEDARERILSFLEWEEPDEEIFAETVRILLVSEDFGKELTTAVLWLRERDIDIRCVRLRPYLDDGKRLVDVQQIIPLPEADSYQVKLRQKEQVGRKQHAARYDERLRFWEGLIAICRTRKTLHGERKPSKYNWLGGSCGKRGIGLNYLITQREGIVQLYIDRGDEAENERLFEQLHAQRSQIDQSFGGPLSWERLEGKRACRIQHVIDTGGYRSPESEWPTIQTAMVDAMTKLQHAVLPHLASLDFG